MKLTEKQRRVIKITWHILKPRHTLIFPQILRYMLLFFLSVFGVIGVELLGTNMISDAGVVVAWTFLVTMTIAGYLYFMALLQSRGYFFFGGMMLLLGLFGDSIWILISMGWIVLFSCVWLVDLLIFDKKGLRHD